MAAARVKLDSKAVRDLLRSDEVKADLERRARAIAAAAGEGFEVDSDVGPARARASVRSATLEAHVAEATDRALTRAIDAGRS